MTRSHLSANGFQPYHFVRTPSQFVLQFADVSTGRPEKGSILQQICRFVRMTFLWHINCHTTAREAVM